MDRLRVSERLACGVAIVAIQVLPHELIELGLTFVNSRLAFSAVRRAVSAACRNSRLEPVAAVGGELLGQGIDQSHGGLGIGPSVGDRDVIRPRRVVVLPGYLDTIRQVARDAISANRRSKVRRTAQRPTGDDLVGRGLGHPDRGGRHE